MEWLEFWMDVGFVSKRQETEWDRTVGSSSFSWACQAASTYLEAGLDLHDAMQGPMHMNPVLLPQALCHF